MRCKRAISILLTIGMSLSSFPLRAADTDYMMQAKHLKQAVDQLAVYQYQLKFNQAIVSEQLFTTGMMEFVNRDLKSVTSLLDALSSQRSKIEAGLKFLSASGFMTLNQDMMLWMEQKVKVEARLNQTEKAALAILARENFFDRFCSVYPNLVRAESLVYQPLNFGIATGLDYSKYSTVFTGGGTTRSGGWIFSQDPKVEAETVIGSSVTALLTLGTISVIYDVLPASFLTLQILADGSVTLGTTVALGGSGAGATAEVGAVGAGTAMTAAAVVIVLAAVAYAEWRTSEANKKREKEAKKKYEAELAHFNEAQMWYNSNRLNQEQLVALAQNTCANEKTQKTLSEYKKQFEAQLALSIRSLLDQIRLARVNLETTEQTLKAGVDQYEKELSRQLEAEAIENLRQDLIAANKVSSIWLIFNEQIKPLLDQHLQRSIKEGCSQGAENWTATQQALRLSLDQIGSILDSNSLQQKEAWEEVQRRTIRMQDVLQKRFAACPSSGGNIYDF